MDDDALPKPVEAGRLYMTVAQACTALGIHRETLYAILAANQIPHLRHGRTIRIHREAVESGAICEQVDVATRPRHEEDDE